MRQLRHITCRSSPTRETKHAGLILTKDYSDNASFASCGGDRAVFLWDVTSASVTRKFAGNNGHTAKVNCVAFAGQDTSVLVSGSFDATVRLWDLKSKSQNPIQVLDDASDAIQAIVVHGEKVLVGSVDGRVRSYDVRMGRFITDVVAAPVTSLTATRDGEGYLVGTLDGKIRLMDWGSGGCLKAYQGAAGGEYRIQSTFGANERWVLSGSEEDGEVCVWDTMTGDLVKKVQVPRSEEAMKTKVDKFGNVVERKNVISCVAWRNDARSMQWCASGTDGQVTVFGDAD